MSTGIVESPPEASTLPASDAPLFEVVSGERVELPPMSIYSNLITWRIARALDGFVAKHGNGTVVMEALLILDGEHDRRRRPDVAFVAVDRWPLDREVPEEGDWEVVPTIAIELTSPHDLFTDVHAKVREYFEYGVKHVWVVIPEERQVYAYRSPTDVDIHGVTSTTTGGKALPGFELPLSDLFRRTTAMPA